MMIVYTQMYSSLSVYLRDNHGINPQGYGFLMTTSAITVVLFQFWLTRNIKHLPPFLLMAFGTIFYMIGFALFGIVTTFILFALNIVIITIGEMIIMPTSQALVAGFAPAKMRGRYMAIAGLSWAIPSTIGPGAAGDILDNYNPNLLWFIGGALCGVSYSHTCPSSPPRRKQFAPARGRCRSGHRLTNSPAGGLFVRRVLHFQG
jgi:MFS family permease